MSLSDLSASELARIDSICLEFEEGLRAGKEFSIDDLVERFGGDHSDILREELRSVREELNESKVAPEDTRTFFAPGVGQTDGNFPRKSGIPIPDKDGPFGQPTDSGLASLSQTPFEKPGSSPADNPPNEDSTAANHLPEPGTRLGPYVIGQQIGSGGMGVVYSAYDERLNRTVAIKMLASELAGRRDLNERFYREARAVAAISHPNIIELFDVGSYRGLPYAVMEFLDGTPMDQWLHQSNISPAEVRRFGAQIADALATAHNAGVIHRDLKPQNIMLVGSAKSHGGSDSANPSGANPNAAAVRQVLPDDGTAKPVDGTSDSITDSTIAKVFDFGLSRFSLQSESSDSSQDADDKTREGVIMGTPGYMAPEQAVGETVTDAADIFSLGCVLHEAFYGRRAFEGRSKSDRTTATINQSPNIDETITPTDPALAGLIAECLQKSAKDRPTDAAQVATDLRTSGISESGLQSAVSLSQAMSSSRRTWMTVVGGGIGAGVVGGLAGMFFLPSVSTPMPNISSLAVLTFEDSALNSTDNVSRLRGASLEPIGKQALTPGNSLPGLLVHELARVPGLIVPTYRPATATTPEEYRQLGRRLEVEAMLVGSIQPVGTLQSMVDSITGERIGQTNKLWQLDLRLISSETGTEIWGQRMKTSAGEHLLAQTRVASEIAEKVGFELTATADEKNKPVQDQFHCLVDGRLRADPDSVSGLRQALMCFYRAHNHDPSYADPIAGIALTSITLAANTPKSESIELVRDARDKAAQALGLKNDSVEARLAKAMVQWQTLTRYDDAETLFRQLVKEVPNQWQVRHQYGLFLLAIGDIEKAITSLREATLLNPMSYAAKVDLARAYWFSGQTSRAIADAKRLLARSPRELTVRGLLIDIYEAEDDLVGALGFDSGVPSYDNNTDAQFDVAPEEVESQYWVIRRKRLAGMPYGPFGEEVNRLIYTSRSQTLDDVSLGEFTEDVTPMLPLILSAHPSLASVRDTMRVQEILRQPKTPAA